MRSEGGGFTIEVESVRLGKVEASVDKDVHRREAPLDLSADPSVLTQRETDVIRRMAMGKSNAEIGDELHIATTTVRNHISSIYRKTGIGCAREAVAWAWRHALVEDGRFPDALEQDLVIHLKVRFTPL